MVGKRVMEWNQSMATSERESKYGASVAAVHIQPLQVQCSSTKVTASPGILSLIRTWFLCRKDPFDVDWSAWATNILATSLFVADVISDFLVAVYHFQEENYGYSGISFAIFFIPMFLSIGYYPIYKKYPWYLAHPFEPLYWFKKASDEYRKIRCQKKLPMGREEAWAHFNSVKNFRAANWARVSAVRLEVHLQALPQLIFQSYTIAELLHDQELKNISWFSWTSMALSTVSLAMYHHTLALAQAKILERDPDDHQEDTSRASPSILFDFIGQGFLDIIYITARSVALACLFTVGFHRQKHTAHGTWLTALIFFVFHLSIASALMWFAGPKSASEFKPDFRLILYNRTNHPDIFTAAVASFLFPPLMDINKVDNSNSFIDHLLMAGTKTFWLTGALQILETLGMLLIWYRVNFDSIGIHTRNIAMGTVIGTMIFALLGHVFYVSCIYMPIKQRERLRCIRNKGIMARCWILETADIHHNYLHDVIMPKLTNTGFLAFQSKNSTLDLDHLVEHTSPSESIDRILAGVSAELLSNQSSQFVLTADDLTWLTETLFVVTTSKEHSGNESLNWRRKQFFRSLLPLERILASRIERHAQRQLDDVVRYGAIYDSDEKNQLVTDCKKLIMFWSDVIYRVITHQHLPVGLGELSWPNIPLMIQWHEAAIQRDTDLPDAVHVANESAANVQSEQDQSLDESNLQKEELDRDTDLMIQKHRRKMSVVDRPAAESIRRESPISKEREERETMIWF